MVEENLTKKVADPERSLTRKEKRELVKEEKRTRVGQEENLRKLKNFFIWVFVAGIIAFIGFKAYSLITVPTPKVAGSAIELVESDWVKGDKESEIMLVEYGDFQCPACVNYFPLLERLLEEVPSGFAFVYRQFPLTSIHPNAMPAAKASEAAGKQGKFWEMYKILYEKHDEWAEDKNAKEKFISYAEELKLDKEHFLSDFGSSSIQDKIKSDIQSGERLNINSTPTFFLNGRKIQPRNYNEFKKLVEDEIRGYTVN